MLRVLLTLLCVTTTASAAMPFEVPPLALPAPKIFEPVLPAACAGTALQPIQLPPIWAPCFARLLDFPGHSVAGLIELFGSTERYREALEATRLDVVRITGRSLTAEAPGDYTEGEAVKLVGWQAAILQHTLTDDTSYNWDYDEVYDCVPVYDFRIKFQRGKKTLIAELSLSAQTVRILDGANVVAEQPLSEYGYTLLKFLAELADVRERRCAALPPPPQRQPRR